MDDMKLVSFRLPASKAKELESVAEVDRTSVSEAVRSAIDTHIEARRKDPEFQDRLRKSLEEHRDILEQLAK